LNETTRESLRLDEKHDLVAYSNVL